ncbi:MAG: hypothetical protein ACR2PK_16245, partial [Acidimicrobiales bacterium]
MNSAALVPPAIAETLRRMPPGSALLIHGPRFSGRSEIVSALADESSVYLQGRGTVHSDQVALERPGLNVDLDASLADQLATAHERLSSVEWLLIDDLDLFDEASARLLTAIATRASEWALRVVATSSSHIDLSPWPQQSVGVAPLNHSVSPASLGLDVTNEELAQLIASTGGWLGLVRAETAGTLDVLLDRVLDALDSDTEIVAQACAWSAQASDDSLAFATGLEAPAIDLALRGLVEASVLSWNWAIPPRIAATIRDRTPPGRRRELARQIVAHGRADRAEMVAAYLTETDDRSSAAYEVLITAARVEVQNAPERATQLFDAAEALVPRRDAEHVDGVNPMGAAEVAVDHARACLMAGQPDRAIALLH